MRPGIERKGRAVDGQKSAACGAYPELRDARFEEQHVLAVHRAVDGLLEDAAVLPRERRTDPGLDRDRVREIEHGARRYDNRRPRPREHCGGIAADRTGLPETHAGVDRASETVTARVGGARAAGGVAQSPVPRGMTGQYLLRGTTDLDRPERAGCDLPARGAAALA